MLGIADRTESISQASLDHKMKSRKFHSPIIGISTCPLTPATLALMQSLDTHRKALKSLKREHDKHLEREKALGQILDTLRTGYNPNYQDMAVLEAVRGWEELAGLPHINDVGRDEAKAEVKSKEQSAEDSVDLEMWSTSQLESGLNGLLETDHVSLLLEHEEHIQASQEDSFREYSLTFSMVHT
jgi:protein kinase C substrate 80K-H